MRLNVSIGTEFLEFLELASLVTRFKRLWRPDYSDSILVASSNYLDQMQSHRHWRRCGSKMALNSAVSL